MTQPGRTSPSGGLRGAVSKWLGLTPTAPDLVQAILQLSEQVGAQRAALESMQTRLAALQEQVDRLEKQQMRSGKEQFKANLLSESQQQSAKDMLAQLRENETYREREIAQLRDRLSGARGEGRLEVVRQIFAALDGLDEALASGERWLAQHRSHQPAAADAAPVAAKPSLWQRLTRAQPAPPPTASAPDKDLPALSGWLEGLELVRRRLFDVLAAQGIVPLETDGAGFDPTLHVAVEVVAAQNGFAPGQIVSTQRRGYRQGEHVLRFAEVVVAHEASSKGSES
jgi:cell division protein FtsB